MPVYCESYALLSLFYLLKIPLTGTKSLNSHGFVIFSRSELEESIKIDALKYLSTKYYTHKVLVLRLADIARKNCFSILYLKKNLKF